jgi:uncharacterized protein YukE
MSWIVQVEDRVNELLTALERIADALEKIAQALTKEEPDA